MNKPAEIAFQSGIAALRDGRTQDAERFLLEVIEADPNHAAALYNLGVLHYQADRLEDSEGMLLRAVQLRPSHVDTRSVLAAVSVGLKNINDAVGHAKVIIQSDAADAPALHSAGQVMGLAGRADEAENAYRRARVVDSTYLLPALALVSQLLSRRAFAEALAVCEAALQHHPQDQDMHLRRAQALWEDGKTAQAKDALHNLLDFAPDHITAHYNLSLFADQDDPQTIIDRLSILIAENDLSPADAVKAWFALGNLYASQGQEEEALASFTAGNTLRQAVATPMHAQSSAAFESSVDALIRSLLQEVPPAEKLSGPTPLIIAGPSRSGKSLLQAWLSAHPDIAAADEVGVLPKLAEQDFMNDPVGKAEAAEIYRKALANLGGSARYVIDTHPTNALYLDLLLELCPDAKVIQIHRDPLDLAVSIFFRNFVTGGHWADTWDGIAARLRCYDKLREHWSDWSPVIATLRYEDVVRSPAETLHLIVDQLGLAWDKSLGFPNEPPNLSNPKPMPWASFADRPQVRQDSIGLWKLFAPWLAEFADAYGRRDLANANAIPVGEVTPVSQFQRAVDALHGGSVLGQEAAQALKNMPAFHGALARRAEDSGLWDEALAAGWLAVSCRPFTSRTNKHAAALQQIVRRSPKHQDIASLHEDVSRAWTAYRDSSSLRFGDYGLMYQSYAPAFIPGSRDTEARAETYDLQSLCAGKRVLDLGCNTGFLALTAANYAETVLGVEKETALVEIGLRVISHLGVKNCDLQSGDAANYHTNNAFDVVIAAAIHGWIDMPIADLGCQLAALTAPDGAVLFESQGQRSTTVIEADFQNKVMAFCEAGFQIERQGQICDDRVNLRAFVILRKI